MLDLQQTTSLPFEEGFPSGQRDQTVNLTAPPSVVRIHPPPPFLKWAGGKAGCPVHLLSQVAKAKQVIQEEVQQATAEETGGCSSMVELQPSKLTVWVRFPSPAPVFWG